MSWQVMLSSMGEGMLRTLAIFFLTILFSMPLGMVVTLLRRSRFRIISARTICSALPSAATVSPLSSSVSP